MTDYREQAIQDVGNALDDGEDFVGAYADGYDEGDDYGRAVNYAVAQREARLRLEDLLCDCILQLSAHEGDSDEVKEWRAALNAVKEG